MTAEDYAEQIKDELNNNWLPQIYRERVLKMKTRPYDFGSLERKPRVVIQHTLLGVELKVGHRRLLCPDLATARYLSVFARAGCTRVAVPYDITRVSRLADEFESAWFRMQLLVDRAAAGRSDAFKARIHGRLIAKLRSEILEAGFGATGPQFTQGKRQRE